MEQQQQPTRADRMPTPEEERAAERAEREIDRDEVGEHFREMTELGAEVKGEGEILPDDET